VIARQKPPALLVVVLPLFVKVCPEAGEREAGNILIDFLYAGLYHGKRFPEGASGAKVSNKFGDVSRVRRGKDFV